MAYSAGALDQLVTLQRAVLTPDGAGGWTATVQDVATVCALMRPKSGAERAAWGGIAATAMYHCVIRSGLDVKASDTLLWDGQHFNIRFIANRGRSAWLEMDVERGVAV